jgi:hypothetical protein
VRQPGSPARHLTAVGRRREEVETELADAHLGAVVEHGAVDALAVDVAAVEGTLIDELEEAAGAGDLRVPTGDGDVIEEDVGSGWRPTVVTSVSSR